MLVAGFMNVSYFSYHTNQSKVYFQACIIQQKRLSSICMTTVMTDPRYPISVQYILYIKSHFHYRAKEKFGNFPKNNRQIFVAWRSVEMRKETQLYTHSWNIFSVHQNALKYNYQSLDLPHIVVSINVRNVADPHSFVRSIQEHTVIL